MDNKNLATHMAAIMNGAKGMMDYIESEKAKMTPEQKVDLDKRMQDVHGMGLDEKLLEVKDSFVDVGKQLKKQSEKK